MANAILSQRGGGGGYATVKFKNYGAEEMPRLATTTSLTEAKIQMDATSVGDHALFGGGYVWDGSITNSNVSFSTVDIFSIDLVRKTPSSLSNARNLVGATTIGDYALFAGGQRYDYSASTTVFLSTVDTFNSNLVKGSATSLSLGRYIAGGAATVGDYALFAGGNISISSPKAFLIAGVASIF